MGKKQLQILSDIPIKLKPTGKLFPNHPFWDSLRLPKAHLVLLTVKSRILEKADEWGTAKNSRNTESLRYGLCSPSNKPLSCFAKVSFTVCDLLCNYSKEILELINYLTQYKTFKLSYRPYKCHNGCHLLTLIYNDILQMLLERADIFSSKL